MLGGHFVDTGWCVVLDETYFLRYKPEVRIGGV